MTTARPKLAPFGLIAAVALALLAVVATGTAQHAAAAAPVANDDGYSVKEQSILGDVQLVVDAPGLLANDADPDGDPMVADVVAGSGPAHGDLNQFGGDGSFLYIPYSGFTGTDSFQYVVQAGGEESAPATVMIAITSNNPPIANDDGFAVDEDDVLSIPAPGILGNDGDADGDTLTVNGWSSASHGDVTVQTDGSFTYTPDPGFSGQDGFSYSVHDGTSVSNVATVTITVSQVNHVPVATDDAYVVAHENAPLSVNAPGVLANDTDLDGDPLVADVIFNSGPSNGTLNEFGADGHFVYTPYKGFAGVDSFQYFVDDGQTQSAPATITITVTNNPPVAFDDAYSVPAGGSLQIAAPGLFANDSDADGDPVFIPVGVQATNGLVTVQDDDGSFTYTPNPGFVGIDSFTYKLSDDMEFSNDATVTITVTAPPTPVPANTPPVAVDDSYSTPQDTPLTISAPGLLANDSDADGDPLTVVGNLSYGSHGEAWLNADGSFTYTPQPGFNGVDVFDYYVVDGIDFSNYGYVTITVGTGNVGNPPVGVNDSYTTTQDTPLLVGAGGVLANDTDLDGDPLTAQQTTWPSHGTANLNPDGSFTYTPDSGFHGTDSFLYYPSDGVNLGLDTKVTIVVTDGGSSTPTPDPSGTPDPSPTSTPTSDPGGKPTATPSGTPPEGDKGTPTATPTDAPGGATETPVPGDNGDGSDESDGGVTASGSGDESGSDTGSAADDPDATPTPIARTLPDTGGGPTGGESSDALLPAILLTIGLAGMAIGLRRRGGVA